MATLDLMAAQQEVVSIVAEVRANFSQSRVKDFKVFCSFLKQKKARLWEILRMTQSSDTDDVLSTPVAEAVKEIDSYMSPTEGERATVV